MIRSENNLWMGFLLGIIAGGSGLYLFGTKEGRVLLKKILENLDNLELSAEDIVSDVIGLVEKETGINKESTITEHPSGSMDLVINKIKRSFPMK